MQVVHSGTSAHAIYPFVTPPAVHRARAACQLCRTKKVRCDARDGKRCSNCIFDNIQCVLVPKRPRKKTKATRHIPPAVVSSPKESFVAADINEKSPAPLQNEVEASDAMELPDLAEADDHPGLEPVPLEPPWTPGGLRQPQTYSHKSRSFGTFPSAPRLRETVLDLPDYIKPLPAHLGADDIEYLQRKGVFTLPDPALRDECLRCYFLHVHQLYPAVDYVQVWSLLNGSPAGKVRLSLLLLQAMIFAGSMWADVRLVRSAGFLSRKSFRQSIHQKIRFLYDADYEDDRLTLVQSLLLWSFWWKGLNEQKDGWHWIGVAQSIARTVDLHHSATEAGSKPRLQRLRRRLWWALCTREVIGSFGLSRAPRIKNGDHDVPMLQLDDLPYSDIIPEEPSAMATPTEAQHLVLARLTIEFVKLNRIFGRILSVACPENAAGRTAVLYSAQQMEGSNNVSSTRQLNIQDLNSCEDELTRWRHQVPGDLWHTAPLPFSPAAWHKAELCHRGMLWMIYHVALMTIHRPQMLPSESAAPSPSGTSERNRKHASCAIVRHAAREITTIAMDLYRADLFTSMSATVVSCLMPVSIHHAFDMFSADAMTRSEASRQLDECRAMLYTLTEQQFAPAWILRTVEHILSRAKQHRDAANTSPLARGATSHTQDRPYESRSPANETIVTFNPLSMTNNDVSRNIDSLAGTAASNLQEQRAGVTSTNPPASQSDWTSFLENPEGFSGFQLAPLTGPLYPADENNSEGLEEMWFDFARVSEAVTGMGWTNGNFWP